MAFFCDNVSTNTQLDNFLKSAAGEIDGPAPPGRPLQPERTAKDAVDGGFTVAVIEPRALIRDCLSRSLGCFIGSYRVLPCASLVECIELMNGQHRIALILMSTARLRPLDEDTERRLGELSEAGELPPTVLLSDREDAEEILRAIDGGARGYIPTSVPLEVAVEALRLVKAGGVYVPASSLTAARRVYGGSNGPQVRRNGVFTERQTAVVQALRQGKANKMIAYELDMRESTVKVHVRNIMKKLKAKNRTEVAYLTRDLFETDSED